MKKLSLVTISVLMVVQLLATEKVDIPANKAIELRYAEFENFDVKITNKSGKQVNVSVIDPNNRGQVRGFGLGPLGTAVVYVESKNILRLKNTSSKDISLTVSFVEREPVKESSANKVQFTLRNSTMKSIPLIIPNVMNPNLSPMSNSGVYLEIGQKIYLKRGLAKVLLLEVDEKIQEGDKIDVAKLIKNLE